MIGILAVSLATAAPGDLVTLRYKLHTGQNLQYAMSTVASMTIPDNHGPKDYNVDSNVLYIENVGIVDPKGVAVIEARLSDPHYVINGKEFKLKPGIGVSSVWRMLPTGQIQSETVLGSSGKTAMSFNSSTLSLPSCLPEGPVRVGSSWTSTGSHAGHQAATFKYVLKSIGTENGRHIATIDGTGTGDIGEMLKGIVEKNPSGLTGTAAYKAQYRFDIDRGLMLATNSQVTIQMSVPAVDQLTKAKTNLSGAGRIQSVKELVETGA